MIGKEIVAERHVTLAEVSEILEKRAGEGELEFEQQAAREHAKEFAKASKKDAEKIVAELKQFGNIKPEIAVKIADLLPASADDLKLLFGKERYSLSQEEVESVLKIVAKCK